jgi:hypothetical protein
VLVRRANLKTSWTRVVWPTIEVLSPGRLDDSCDPFRTEIQLGWFRECWGTASGRKAWKVGGACQSPGGGLNCHWPVTSDRELDLPFDPCIHANNVGIEVSVLALLRSKLA